MAGPDPSVAGISDLEFVASNGAEDLYRARDVDTGTRLAVRVFRALSDVRKQRFARERDDLTDLSRREGVVSIEQSGFTDSGEPFIVTSFFDQGSLQDRLDEVGVLDPGQAFGVVESVARTLHAAHQRNIVHGNIKPSKIFVTSSGQPQIADLGLFAFLAGDEEGHRTTASLASGYVAPEVVAGAQPSIGSDVYALGATLLALAREPPPPIGPIAAGNAVDGTEVVAETIQDVGPGDLSDAQWAVIESATAREPSQRVATAGLLADRLHQATPASLEPGSPQPDQQPPAVAGSRARSDGPARQVDAPSRRPGPSRRARDTGPGRSRARMWVGLAVVLILGGVVASVAAFSSTTSSTGPGLAASPVAEVSNNPFVGAWISEDLPEGTLILLDIAADGRFDHVDQDVLSPTCDGSVDWEGTGVFDTHTDGKPRFAAIGDRYCDGVGGRFFLNTTPDNPDLLAFTYDEATDTLLFLGDDPALGVGCYYRPGADTSICD